MKKDLYMSHDSASDVKTTMPSAEFAFKRAPLERQGGFFALETAIVGKNNFDKEWVGQRLKRNFPKIHPIWNRQASHSK